MDDDTNVPKLYLTKLFQGNEDEIYIKKKRTIPPLDKANKLTSEQSKMICKSNHELLPLSVKEILFIIHQKFFPKPNSILRINHFVVRIYLSTCKHLHDEEFDQIRVPCSMVVFTE